MVQFVVSSTAFCTGYRYCNILEVFISSVDVAVQVGHPYEVSHK